MNAIDDALFSGTLSLNRFNFPFKIYAVDDVLFQDFFGNVPFHELSRTNLCSDMSNFLSF